MSYEVRIMDRMVWFGYHSFKQKWMRNARERYKTVS